MKNWITKQIVFETVICGEEKTCLLKYVGGRSEEELNEILKKEIKETGIVNLRLEEMEPFSW